MKIYQFCKVSVTNITLLDITLTSNFDNLDTNEKQEFYSLVSKNVKKYRLEKGLSQMSLGLEIGIKSVAFFSNAENNRYDKHFNLEHLYKISKALDKEICDFFK
jgi:DNA-binding XRE family transcriptional regulator